MKKKILLVVAGVVVFILALVYATLGGSSVRMEVCVTYGGQQECRTARGRTAQEAQRTAQENACALLARGMTDSIACQDKQPDSVRNLD